ncbi:MAG TPA: PEP-CTERM sorting domain-containing protein [Isosphaeraceae bacterium]|jgi:hypothetical protein|nr:PEP-CTERM sorting domain-containing protein [Isosphaeraceae bacterium]
MLTNRTLSLTALAVALTLAISTDARADFGAFSYTTTVEAGTNSAFAATSTATQNGVAVTFSGVGASNLLAPTDVTFSDLAVDATNAAVGTTSITVPYKYLVSLTDHSTASPSTQTVEVTGMLSGTVTKTAGGNLSFSISNAYDPITYMVPTVGVFPSGAEYLISTTDTPGHTHYNAPGPDGSMGAAVLLSPKAVPEPASMALLGLGSLGALRLFRRRAI